MFQKLFMLAVGLMGLFSFRRKEKGLSEPRKINNSEVVSDMKNAKGQNIVKLLKDKVAEKTNEGLYMKSLGKMKSKTFSVDPNGRGLRVEQLGDFVLEWEHFQKIIEKANELGGKMYRGDELPQVSGFKLGEEIPYDCMEGFIASKLLYIEDGKSVLRRSTYYSGILAWAGIVTIHGSQGKGSFITVNPEYGNI